MSMKLFESQSKCARTPVPTCRQICEPVRRTSADGHLVVVGSVGLDTDVSCNPKLYTLPYLASIGDKSLKQVNPSLMSPPEWSMPDFSDIDDIEVNSIG